MEMEELEITIGTDGRIQVKVNGGKGTGCLDLTKGLEAAAGVVEERERLPEYYQDACGTEHCTVGRKP